MYKINDVAKIAGISTRTLRYYDNIGLLSPSYTAENSYRFYTDIEIDLLQQILFYKEFGFSLKEIKAILIDEEFNIIDLLDQQKSRIKEKHRQLSKLLITIEKTIRKEKGEIIMSNDEKFLGLKEDEIKDNEEKYGKELRNLYTENAIKESYQKIRKMSSWEFNESKRLAKEIDEKLSAALQTNDINSTLSMEVCLLHKKWIKMYWSNYSKDAHLKLVEMYTLDKRFKEYYDKSGVGATIFLYNSMQLFLKKDH